MEVDGEGWDTEGDEAGVKGGPGGGFSYVFVKLQEALQRLRDKTEALDTVSGELEEARKKVSEY